MRDGDYIFVLKGAELKELTEALEIASKHSHEDEEIVAALDEVDELEQLWQNGCVLTDKSQEHQLLRGLQKAKEVLESFPDDPDLTPEEEAEEKTCVEKELALVNKTLSNLDYQKEAVDEDG